MNHYQTIFLMQQEHGWSHGDIQNMIPFERDIYVIFLKQWIDKKKEDAKKHASSS